MASDNQASRGISKRKDAERAAMEPGRLHEIFDGMLDGILVADAETRKLLFANAAICSMLGYTREEIVRISVLDIHPRQDLPHAIEQFEKLLRGEIQVVADIPMLRNDGSVFYADIKASPIRLGGKSCLLGVFRDNAERKRTELAVARQNDLYNALSHTSQAIVRGASREELFHTICRIAVEHGRFRFAWIGLIEADGQSVKAVARYGDDADYLRKVRFSRDESVPGGRGIIGHVLRAGRRNYTNDILADARHGTWHEAARCAGVRALASFPIRRGSAAIGAINVYSGEPGFFTEDLLATLDEMALILSFGLESLEREAERKLAEQALRDSERLLRESQSMAGLGSYVLDIPTGRWSSSAVLDDIFGIDGNYERSVAGWLSLVHPEWREQMGHYFANEVLGKHVRFDREYQIIRKTDGESRWVHGLGELEFDAQGQLRRMLGTITDITERKRAEQELRAAEELFRGLVEQSLTGIYIVQDGKFVYVNPRFAEIRGYGSANELIGRDNLSVVADKDRGGLVEIYRRLLAGETPSISYDFTGVRKDGSTFDVGVTGARATYRGRPAVIGMMQDISEKKQAANDIQRYIAQLQTAFMSTVEVATTLSEMRDPYTAGHERRVAEIAVAIGAELGFDKRRQEGLRVAGHLHDVGKINIPSEILSKPGRLSAIEMQLVRGHAQASYDVLKAVEFPWPVAQIALQHHERMDGSGYPQGLKGEAIVPEARIMAVADVVEAMASHRPYRPGLGIDRALAEIERGRGTAYDADAADACLRLFRDQGYQLPA